MNYEEQSPPGWFMRKWIWFWYWDVTRIFCMLGLPVLPLVWLLAYVGVSGEERRTYCLIAYFSMFCWMALDSDYSKLRRIGLDEYRNPLSPSN